MFLHVGGNYSVCFKNILAILDGESLRGKRVTRDLIDRLASQGRLIDAMKDQVDGSLHAASYVFTHSDENGEMLYCSPISCQTLLRRIDAASQYQF